MPRVMITGINGFVGGHLAREMHEHGFEVVGVGFDSELRKDRAEIISEYVVSDLSDPDQVSAIDFGSIDSVINLAGLANIGASFDNPEMYMRVNTVILHNICEALRAQSRKSVRVLAISTGAVYDPAQALPLTEESRLIAADKTSPYVLSKQKMEEIAATERAKGSDCVVVRPFNHIGPGQEKGFLLPDLVGQVQTAMTEGSAVTVGNLETKRDYTDVRDVVRAYRLLAGASGLRHDVYNVCSSQAIAGKTILDEVLAQTGANDVEIKIDSSKIRPNDPVELYGSAERLQEELGWKPEIPLKTTVQDFIRQSS